ncbi:MAG: hypothetical protein Q8P90_05655 [bacterium]|nr:hypothetical protein [bacterium]
MDDRRGSKRKSLLSMGNETMVYGVKKEDGTDSKLVIKHLEGRFGKGSEEGFDEETAYELRDRYKSLQKHYGKYIPRQWVMPHYSEKPRKSFFLAQERLQPAEPADVYEYEIGGLQEKSRVQLAEIAGLLKTSYREYEETGTDEGNLPFDLLGDTNLMVTKDGDVRYIDSGFSIRRYSEMSDVHLNEDFKARVAWLELIAEVNPEDIINDEFYTSVFEEFEKKSGLRRSDIERDPNKLLRQIANYTFGIY